MLKKLLNGQTKTITAAAIIIGSASLVSRILGVLRDRVLASEFGAGIQLDMYYTAFRVPDLIFNLIILGALSAGFIPVFSSQLRSQKQAWQFVSVLINVIFVGLLTVSGLMFVLAPWLVRLIAPGFGPEEITITANLTRIMFLSPIFLGVSGVFGGVLQTFRRFFVYSLAPILYNVGIIAGALFLVPIFGIYGLAWGVALGAVMHLLIQIPTVFTLGFKYTPTLDLTTPGFTKMMKMMVPRTLALVTGQLNLLIVTIVGSSLAAGSIAVFNFANNLQSLPLGLFGISFAVAAFPTLTQYANDKKKFIQTLSSATRQILFLILPASALLIVLRAQIVRAVLGAGLFSWEDTVLTLNALSIFALSLFAQSLILLYSRAFFAQEDSHTPFYTGLISAFANIILTMMLIERFGVLGLVLAFSMASVLNLMLLFVVLHHRMGQLDGQKIIWSSSKILIATSMLTLSAWAMKFIVAPIFGTQTLLGVVAQATLSASAGLIAYLVVCWLLQVDELNYLVAGLKRKLLKKAPAPVELVDQE